MNGVSNPADDGARPRILLSAFTADPTAGSESKVGWMRAEQASQYLDAWLMCAPHVSKSGIDEYLAERGGLDPQVEFIGGHAIWHHKF